MGFSRDGHLLVATYQDRVVLSWDLLRVSKFIAGNAEYQWSRLEGELDPTVDVTPAMIWSRRMLAPDMAGH